MIGFLQYQSAEAVIVGLSAAISGVLMLGFGSVIEYLAKIERHLRKQ